MDALTKSTVSVKLWLINVTSVMVAFTCCRSSDSLTTPSTGISVSSELSSNLPKDFDNFTTEVDTYLIGENTTDPQFDGNSSLSLTTPGQLDLLTPPPPEFRIPDPFRLYYINMTYTRRVMSQEVTDFVCGSQGLCNQNQSIKSDICTFECLPCQCDPMCHFYGDCCPDVLFKDSPDFPSPSFQFLTCSSDDWTKWGNFSNIFMVSLCPTNSDVVTRGKCEQPDIFDKEQATPVSDIDTGVTYRNSFCAKCHRISNVKDWIHRVSCGSGESLKKAKSKAELWRLVLLENSCDVTTTPPSGGEARECYLSEIDRCNVTGKWRENVDPAIERLCELYNNPIDYYGSEPFFDRFRNVFCAVCNGAILSRYMSCTRILSPSVPYPLSVLLDFNSDTQLKSSTEEEKIQCEIGTILDPFSNSCQAIRCPGRRLLVDNKCETTFTSTRGLGFTLMAVLRPQKTSHQIPFDGFQDHYLHMLKESLKDFEPVLIQSLLISYFSKDPDERHSASIIMTDARILSSSQKGVDEMDSVLMNIMTRDWSFDMNNETFNVTTRPRVCPDDNVSEGYNLIHLSVNSESVDLLNPICGRLDCLKRITYEPVQLLCPYIEYNLTDANFSFGSTNNTVIFGSNSFVLNQSEFNLCGDILQVCVDVIANIGVILETNSPIARRPVSEQDMTMSIVSLVCIGLSLVGLFLTFLVYSLIPKLRTLPGKNTMALVFHLFWAQLLFLSTSNRTANSTLCKIFGVLVHYFWLSSFSWMSVSAYHMHHVFTALRANTGLSSSGVKRLCCYSAFCIVLPLCVIGSCLTMNLVQTQGTNIGYGGSICFLNDPTVIGAFFAGPLGVMLLLNTFFFVRTILSIRSVPDMTKSSTTTNKQHVFVYLKLSLLFGFTWSFGILAAIFKSDALWYMFIVLTGSQGVMLFVAYCVNKRTWGMVQSKFTEREMTSSASSYVTTKSTNETEEKQGNQKF